MGDGNPNSDGQVDIDSTITKKKKKRGDDSVDNKAGRSVADYKSVNSKKIVEQVFQEAVKESGTDVTSGFQLNECAKKEKQKKKKIRSDESHVDNVECYPLETLGKTKDKKKKKNKLTSDSLVEGAAHGSEDTQHAATTSDANDIQLEDKISKFKKKKKKKDESEEVEKGKSKDDENKISKVDSTVTDDKSSKKRKRLDSEVHDTQPVNENAIEDSKQRKTETTEQLNSLVGADKHVGKENGNIEKNGKHSEQKSSKKQQNGSAQAKKPFQRVNLEEVEFVDSRLEDNSYWAKDGAETGYGAKAQEVLDQVRGRCA
ncbi:Autoinhibited Ca(2+)-ATPase 10 isoform 1 [Hibiscus syriacus]|uniref:Autoinhibited Ca(2+)-ATPase 10 isoform 1 n=1 Tax=Hibiscus syriacus TaxID=106335 RepID=A0A6A2XHP2_HIBSY|nr:Autoinhibited Ca(2+)-ATPase 10 isoform 1 [Hibiscus syriacus]